MKKYLFFIFLPLLLIVTLGASSAQYWTRVQEALNKMIDASTGKFARVDYVDNTSMSTAGLPLTGGTITGNLDVTGNLSRAGYVTPVIIKSQYVNAIMTGTTSTELVTFIIPGGKMGINGSFDVYTEFEFTDISGQKKLDCEYGVNDLFGIDTIGTTAVGYSAITSLINKGSTTSNLNKKIFRSYLANTDSTSIASFSVDTGTDTTWSIKANNVDPATGTITLHYLKVILYPGT